MSRYILRTVRVLGAVEWCLTEVDLHHVMRVLPRAEWEWAYTFSPSHTERVEWVKVRGQTVAALVVLGDYYGMSDESEE